MKIAVIWTWIFGFIGCSGYEALKIYRRLWAKQPIIEKGKRGLYVFTFLILSVFAGFVAFAWANGDIAEALFIGFSIPAGMKAIIPGTHKRHRTNHNPKVDDEDLIDDIELSESISNKNIKENPISKVTSWVEDFFYYPED